MAPPTELDLHAMLSGLVASHAWLPPGADTESFPLHAAGGMLASLLTFFITLARHSRPAVCTLVGLSLAFWWNVIFRPLATKEKTSPAYTAAYGMWLVWMVLGLLWGESLTHRDEALGSWLGTVYTDLLLPVLCVYVGSRQGYTNYALQNIDILLLWGGIIFSDTATHTFGAHTQLHHVLAGAIRVLLFFTAFLFFHYYRVEMPYGRQYPFLYPEPNRFVAQDRNALLLSAWVLLCSFIAIAVYMPLLVVLYLSTMNKLAADIKAMQENSQVSTARHCSCGGIDHRMETGAIDYHSDGVDTLPRSPVGKVREKEDDGDSSAGSEEEEEEDEDDEEGSSEEEESSEESEEEGFQQNMPVYFLQQLYNKNQ